MKKTLKPNGMPSRAVQKGSLEERRELDKLSKEIARYDIEAVDYIADGVAWMKRNEGRKAGMETDVDRMHEQYAQAVLLKCAEPLSKGVTEDSIGEATGMFLAGYMMNSRFREGVNQKVMKLAQPMVAQKADATGFRFLQRWSDRMAAAGNDGRIPLTPKSAAMMQLGLSKKAYREMREDGADVDAVMKSYHESMDRLYNIAAQDGVSRNVLNQNVRRTVGKMSSIDPSVTQFFSETGFGDVQKARGQEINVNGRVMYQWSGEYADRNGNLYQDAFRPRQPMDRGNRISALEKTLQGGFSNCNTAEDIREFLSVVQGASTKDWPEEKVQKYGWMESWQNKMLNVYDMALNDCKNASEAMQLDEDLVYCTKTQFSGWANRHKDVMHEIQRDYYDKKGPHAREHGTQQTSARRIPDFPSGGSDTGYDCSFSS